MNREGDGLPSRWSKTTLGSLVEVLRGVSYKKVDASSISTEGLVPLLRATNIDRVLNFDGLVYVPTHYVNPDQYLRAGDIVIAGSSGSSAVVGKAAQLNKEWFGTFGAFCLGLRAVSAMDNRFLAWFLQGDEYRNRTSQLAAGVNINNLRREHIEGIPIPLPPLAEQRRIVAEIGRHFTRLDASVTALKRAQANLKRFRASVLKAACEGKLVPTEAELARSEGRSYEPADRLLERILSERRDYQWAREKRRGRYKETSSPDTSALSELPKGWVWATLSQISDLKGGATKGRRFRAGESLTEVPYLRVANVQRGYLDLSEIKTIEVTQEVADQLALVPGDILFTEGGDRDKLGRGWVWKGELDGCIHQNHIFRSRLLLSEMDPEFVSWWGNSFGQTFFEQSGKQTTNLASINLSVLSSFPVPLPPLAEQRRIVAEVERRLSVIQKAEATVEANLTRAERLRQSILKQAFSGNLVPQDPNDEPASALLERIRTEREATQAAAKPKSRAKRRRARSSPERQLILGVQEKTS